MAKIEDLIAQIPDERLRKGIAAEVKLLQSNPAGEFPAHTRRKVFP